MVKGVNARREENEYRVNHTVTYTLAEGPIPNERQVSTQKLPLER
jgi:hypothetical protein